VVAGKISSFVAKKKLIRFTENLSYPHLLQPRYRDLLPVFRLYGNWGPAYFRNTNPITLELGCGKGEYTVGLARSYPEQNFIGIDVKGARLWRGCKTVSEEGLQNVVFLRTRADHLESVFAPGEISAIWLTFPDPQSGKERKRLTSPVFLARYRKVLSPSGIVHLKTDDPDLFAYTLQQLEDMKAELLLVTEDVYQACLQDPVTQIQTYYEHLWQDEGRKILYLKFRFR
jgi:tRNA (guanine-N7-)-methyltransferase